MTTELRKAYYEGYWDGSHRKLQASKYIPHEREKAWGKSDTKAREKKGQEFEREGRLLRILDDKMRESFGFGLGRPGEPPESAPQAKAMCEAIEEYIDLKLKELEKL